jgi:hypothetical protein
LELDRRGCVDNPWPGDTLVVPLLPWLIEESFTKPSGE